MKRYINPTEDREVSTIQQELEELVHGQLGEAQLDERGEVVILTSTGRRFTVQIWEVM